MHDLKHVQLLHHNRFFHFKIHSNICTTLHRLERLRHSAHATQTTHNLVHHAQLTTPPGAQPLSTGGPSPLLPGYQVITKMCFQYFQTPESLELFVTTPSTEMVKMYRFQMCPGLPPKVFDTAKHI